MSDIEDRLKSLKRDQLVSLLAGAKKVLPLNTANKSRPAMVKMAMALHGSSASPNKFDGKILFGDSKESAHIVLPARESKAETKIKKGVKAVAKAAKPAKEAKDDKAELKKELMADMKAANEMDQVKANIKKIKDIKSKMKTASPEMLKEYQRDIEKMLK